MAMLSEFQTVRAHTTSRIPRILDEAPNPLSALVVFRKESCIPGKVADVGLNLAGTKQTTEVATSTITANFPSASLSDPRQPQTKISTSIQHSSPPPPPPHSEQSEPPELILRPGHHLLRPHRRLVRSLPCTSQKSSDQTAPNLPRNRRRHNHKTNISCHRKDKLKYGPPLSMITQGFYSTSSPTTNWVAQQSQNLVHDPATSYAYEAEYKSFSSDHNLFYQNLVPNLSKYAESSRANEKSSQHTAQIARIMEGVNPNRNSDQFEETTSDESDLYLAAAKEEELLRKFGVTNSLAPTSERKPRSRHTMLSPRNNTNKSTYFRHESDHESVSNSSKTKKLDIYRRTSEYKSEMRDQSITSEQFNKIGHSRGYVSSIPSTPRDRSRETPCSDSTSQHAGRRLLVSSAHQSIPSGSRRSSVPDSTISTRPVIRQLKGMSTPHIYHSSPLASRSTELHEISDAGCHKEDTESSVSTTAHSTVWDELDDLKSRIQRLEFTGKLPPNLWMDNSRSSNERPLTATTTVTSMSTSPKRDRANSKPSIDPNARIIASDACVILKSALIKSRPFLAPEIYRALEATTSDAITLTSMTGNSAQPSSSNNTHVPSYGPTSFLEKQLRRKAESMCRSLTELCIAMSDRNFENEKPANFMDSHESRSRSALEPSSNLNSSRSSPRVLSHLEARRSSLLAPSISHYHHAQSGSESTSVKFPVVRRTSLFFRGSQNSLKSSETGARTPSRVFSEINHTRNSPHDRIYPTCHSEKKPSVENQSLLPLRRQHTSTGCYPLSSIPTISGSNSWRKSERATPERGRISNGTPV